MIQASLTYTTSVPIKISNQLKLLANKAVAEKNTSVIKKKTCKYCLDLNVGSFKKR